MTYTPYLRTDQKEVYNPIIWEGDFEDISTEIVPENQFARSDLFTDPQLEPKRCRIWQRIGSSTLPTDLIVEERFLQQHASPFIGQFVAVLMDTSVTNLWGEKFKSNSLKRFSDISQSWVSIDDFANLSDIFHPQSFHRVSRFLLKNSFLIPIITEARIRIEKYFPQSPLNLELITDPEDDGEQQIVLNIFSNFQVDTALKLLDQFDHSWWLDVVDKVNGKLAINLEFK